MSGAELPRAARLRLAADFAALRQARGRIRGQFFMLRYDANDVNAARLGLAVSRKVSLRAVERNRIKRAVRERFRHARERMPALDILVIAHRDAAGQPSAALRADLDHLWPRLKPLARRAPPGTQPG